MSTRAERRERKTSQHPLARLRRGECMNCGHEGRHYVPPSMGESGFFACESFCESCRPTTPNIDTDRSTE